MNPPLHQPIVAAKTEVSRRSSSRRAGLTFVELLIVMTIILILALIGFPMMLCALQKARAAAIISDLRQARDIVETFIVEHERAPTTLQEAYDVQSRGSPRPDHLFYCNAELGDLNKGHGNDICDLSDEENPGNESPIGLDVGPYYIRTPFELLSTRCGDIDFAWVHCCGMSPEIFKNGEWQGRPPGGGGGGSGGGGKGGAS